MNTPILVDRFMRSAIAGVAACCVVSIAAARPGEPDRSATIEVFAERYVAGNMAFDDLDRLEKHVTAAHVRRIMFLLCGANATRSFKAAVHRFRHVPMQMRVPDADEFNCRSRTPITPVRHRAGQPPFGIDDQAVERYWLDMTP